MQYLKRYYSMFILLLVTLTLALLPAGTGRAAAAEIDPRFRDYYNQHDGMRVLGFAHAPLEQANGYPAQLFEKGRLEDHRRDTTGPNWFLHDAGGEYLIGANDRQMTQQLLDVSWTGAQVQVWGTLHPAGATGEGINLARIEVIGTATNQSRNLSPHATASASSVLPAGRTVDRTAIRTMTDAGYSTRSMWKEKTCAMLVMTMPGASGAMA